MRTKYAYTKYLLKRKENIMEVKKVKGDYINAIEPGVLVAFKSEDKMVAAKVISKHEKEVDGGIIPYVKVETKNGSIYFVDNVDIAWVKTGSRWPAGIYNALKQGR
jgi:hypothetical protein